MPTQCTTVTFTQTLYGNEASQADWCSAGCQFETQLAYDGVTGCRVPLCHSSLTISPNYFSTSVVLQQTFASDASSFSPQRLSRFKEEYCIRTGCRVPFCQAALAIVAGSVGLRVLLAIPDALAGSNGSSNESSTAAAVAAAANALAAQPLSAISAMMNETVVSSSSPVVSRVRRIDVQVVLSIPDADASTASTVASVTAAANTLVAQPTAVASLLNATVISTSPVVIGHAVVPLVVSTPPANIARNASGRPTTIIGVVVPIVVLLIVSTAIAYACYRRQAILATREELLAEEKRRQESDQNAATRRSAHLSRRSTARRPRSSLPPVIEVDIDEERSGKEGKGVEVEMPATGVAAEDETAREQRKHEALEELRKRTSSFALPKVPSAKFTNVNDVTRGQTKSLARAGSAAPADERSRSDDSVEDV